MVRVKALKEIQFRDQTYEPGDELEVIERLANVWVERSLVAIIGPTPVDPAPVEVAAAELEGEVADEPTPEAKPRGKGKGKGKG